VTPPSLAAARRLRTTCLLLADLATFFLAWVAAFVVAGWFDRAQGSRWFPPFTTGGMLFTVMALLIVLGLAVSGQYARRAAFWEETRVVWRFAVMAALVNFSLNFFVQVSYTRTLIVMAWLLVLVFVPFGRLAAREALIHFGHWKRKALVVGDGDNAVEACRAIRGERHMGIEIAGFMGDGDSLALSHLGTGFPMLGSGENVEEVANELGCSVIVIALDDGAQARAADIAARLYDARFEVFVVPLLHGLPVQSMQAQNFFSNDVLLLRLQHKLLSPVSRLLKRAIDLAASSALLVALLPLMAVVAWRIRREDGGPVFYTQSRVGHNGEDFEFIKFRSMVRDADARLLEWKQANPELYERYEASNFKLADDPRILRTGRWIRRTSIDELPQLWNVLRGEMSLVGPRPLLRRELESYPSHTLSLYSQVLPGITGLWQVSGRSHTTFEQRAAMDGWYVRNWSLWVDWVILLKTVRVVASARGAM
jgi:Undecaprenyl-phosphate galactose phosphotransferase WbaP